MRLDHNQAPAPEQASRPRDDSGSDAPMPSLPADALAIVPVRNLVLFPGMVLPITVGR